MAVGADLRAHVLLELAALLFFGAAEFVLEEGYDAFVAVVVRPGVFAQVGIGEGDLLVSEAVEEAVLLFVGELFPGRVEVEAEVLGGTFVEVQAPAIARDVAQGFERAGADGLPGVGDHQVFAHQHLGAQAATVGAHALRVVEGKHLRRWLLIGDSAGGAVEAGRKQHVVVIFATDDEGAVAQAQRVVDGFFQTRVGLFAQNQAIDDDFDVVAAVAVEVGGLVQGKYLAVDADADIAGFL